ncbi:hypothetical protein [Haladaptatus sp. CMAA 1911]|uniref:hypothetical protein n=1 Tax=unclassified Haladaptatus TaxID=2622732 RepID=UPI0037547C0B
MFDSATTMTTSTHPTPDQTTTGTAIEESSTTQSSTTQTTTTLQSEACAVTNETKEGALIDVRPTIHGSEREVIISTQWRSDTNVSKLDVTLDGNRLFDVQSSVFAGENVSGFGRPVGTAPFAGRLHVELHDNGTQVARYDASVVCER